MKSKYWLVTINITNNRNIIMISRLKGAMKKKKTTWNGKKKKKIDLLYLIDHVEGEAH